MRRVGNSLTWDDNGSWQKNQGDVEIRIGDVKVRMDAVVGRVHQLSFNTRLRGGEIVGTENH